MTPWELWLVDADTLKSGVGGVGVKSGVKVVSYHSAPYSVLCNIFGNFIYI